MRPKRKAATATASPPDELLGPGRRMPRDFTAHSTGDALARWLDQHGHLGERAGQIDPLALLLAAEETWEEFAARNRRSSSAPPRPALHPTGDPSP